MTQQEARYILEATTPFEVRGGHVWLREVRWLRAVERQRSEEATAAAASEGSWWTAPAAGVRQPPPSSAQRERRAVPII
jgi:hypothetical protein